MKKIYQLSSVFVIVVNLEERYNILNQSFLPHDVEPFNFLRENQRDYSAEELNDEYLDGIFKYFERQTLSTAI